jgi:small subunit ribosomal protein S20
MPIIQSAEKKLRQDKKRHEVNVLVKAQLKAAVKKARLNPSPELFSKAFSALDTAAKKHIIHKNTAARLKSRLSHTKAPVAVKVSKRKKTVTKK